MALAIIIALSSHIYAEVQFGVLKIITDNDTAKVYIDGNFEGTGTVSRDKIIIGSHLIQIKDENKNILFEEMVSVREGEQTTIFAKTTGKGVQPVARELLGQYEQPPNLNVVGVEGSYGNWTARMDGYTATSFEPIKEIGLYAKNITGKNSFIKSGIHYIFPLTNASNNIGSFLGVEIGGTSDFIEGTLGLNYLFSNVSGSTGGLGYQGSIGVIISNATIGAKYLVLTASSSWGNYSYSQLLFCASYDFGR